MVFIKFTIKHRVEVVEIMLIYVNQFHLIGENSSETAFRTVSGWLKNVTKRHFSLDELKKCADYSIDRMRVRTYMAIDQKPLMYSVLLSHPDRIIRGRQWITEIGIREEGDKTTVSILLETSDISTQVTEIPATTKPRLVNFLQENGQLSPETIGLKVFNFSNSRESLKALSYEVERLERKYPIVLVSNIKGKNKPVVNPYKLQEQLLGLAQVVHSEDEINSWEMEEILTRKYSAWDGAINIIYPPFGRNYCHTKLLSQTVINEIISSGSHALQSILSYITHTTNGFNKKKHFSPSDVRAKRQKDQRMLLKQRFEKLSEDTEFQELADQAFIQLEEQEKFIEKLKSDYEKDLDDKIILCIEAEDKIDQVNKNLEDANTNNYILNMRLQDLKNNTDKKGKSILVHGVENEHYKGEVSDLVLEIVKINLDSIKLKSRKHHLLQDIVKHNEVDGTQANYIQTIKSIFSNYSGLTPKIKLELKKLNMEVREDGTHNHIKFIGDDRYQVAFAKTPSDTSRVSGNIVRDIKADLF
jgi:hypothetical protein